MKQISVTITGKSNLSREICVEAFGLRVKRVVYAQAAASINYRRKPTAVEITLSREVLSCSHAWRSTSRYKNYSNIEETKSVIVSINDCISDSDILSNANKGLRSRFFIIVAKKDVYNDGNGLKKMQNDANEKAEVLAKDKLDKLCIEATKDILYKMYKGESFRLEKEIEVYKSAHPGVVPSSKEIGSILWRSGESSMSRDDIRRIYFGV